MGSVSSLLKGANARQVAIQNQQDSLASFEYQQSAKTFADYQAYTDFLNNRISSTTDPSKALTYTKAINTAQSGYISNEVQRQSTKVLEGGQTNTDKYNAMVGLYYQAQDTGNQDLAQSMRLQIDNLSVTIQNEQKSAQTLAKQMAAENVTTVEDHVAQQQDIIKQWGDVYSKYGAAGLNDSLQQFADQKGLPSAPGYFDVIAGIIGLPDANGIYPPESILGSLQTSAAGLDPINANKLMADMNKITSGQTSFDVPGLKGVSYSDIIDAVDASRAGQNIYNIGQVDGKNVFVKNKLDNYTWGQDASGQMRLINTYARLGNGLKTDSNIVDRNAQGQLLGTDGKVTTDPTKAARISYENLIHAAGFDIAGTNPDGSFQLIHTTKTAGTALDVTGGGEFSAVIDDSGNLRFKSTDASGQTNLYALNFGTTTDSQGNQTYTGDGNSVSITQLTAENTSVFGDTGFKGSHASDIGQNLIKQIIGQKDISFNPIAPTTISTLQGMSPNSRPLTTNDIVNQAPKLQMTALPQSAPVNPQFQTAPQLQSSNVPNLNQTVVPGNAGLKVTNAPPAPKLSVAAPAPTVPITSVSVAPTTQRITSVGVAQPTGRVTVGP